MRHPVDRRDFLRTATAAGLGLALRPDGAAAAPLRDAGPLAAPFAAPPLETVRIGFVGLGHQGSSHVENFTKIEGARVVAVCDLLPDRVAKMQDLVAKAGQPRPAGYSGGPNEYRRLCERADVDLVYTATPWEWHAPVMLAAMRAGKHAATEVPMAPTLDELWELVETAEKTRKHCVMMENCCYDRTEMMILNMVRQRLFGELIHAECGYLHDLRQLKLTPYYHPDNWRLEHSVRRDGDLYPTHGLGPVAQWMDINRGNQFDHLVSMSTKSRGLNLWAAEREGADSPKAKRAYKLGDVVTTLIRTARGETIRLSHDTDSPRPYSRDIMLQGTKGLVRKYPEQRIYIEGRSPQHDRWEDLLKYREQYEHPIWKALEERSKGAGHGGMDFIEDYRLVECLRAGVPTDMDVYDGAAWSAVGPLSERSIAGRSRSVDFPDFTRGKWKTRKPLAIVASGPAVQG
jgi:predicted dehydrogenase